MGDLHVIAYHVDEIYIEHGQSNSQALEAEYPEIYPIFV
jgi:hypothetical protein